MTICRIRQHGMQLFPGNRILLLKFARWAATVLSVMIQIQGGTDIVNSAHPTGQFDPARLTASPLSD